MQRNIITYLLCGLFVVACSRGPHHLKDRLNSKDISGAWYLTEESVQALTANGNLKDNKLTFSIQLLPSGECRFSSYSTAARRVLNETATWQLDHDISLDSEKITNVLWISFADGRTIERLFIKKTHSEVALWCDADNGWGDSFVISYTRTK
jgi:hypothetical protein